MENFTLTKIFLIVIFFSGCGVNPKKCDPFDECEVRSLKKLFEEYGGNGSVYVSNHFVLVPEYTDCCSGHLEYLSLAKSYVDTASSKYPISDVIFIKSEADFWDAEGLPDDKNLTISALVRVEYKYNDSLPKVSANATVSVYSY